MVGWLGCTKIVETFTRSALQLWRGGLLLRLLSHLGRPAAASFGCERTTDHSAPHHVHLSARYKHQTVLPRIQSASVGVLPLPVLTDLTCTGDPATECPEPDNLLQYVTESYGQSLGQTASPPGKLLALLSQTELTHVMTADM